MIVFKKIFGAIVWYNWQRFLIVRMPKTKALYISNKKSSRLQEGVEAWPSRKQLKEILDNYIKNIADEMV